MCIGVVRKDRRRDEGKDDGQIDGDSGGDGVMSVGISLG